MPQKGLLLTWGLPVSRGKVSAIPPPCDCDLPRLQHCSRRRCLVLRPPACVQPGLQGHLCQQLPVLQRSESMVCQCALQKVHPTSEDGRSA